MPSKTYAIHPAIGVARIGNAEADLNNPSTWYLGPEAPWEVANEGQDYKLAGKIKKQAQRFRIYEYENGQATREITLNETDVSGITWTVHLSNRKAALDTAGNGGSRSAPGVPPASYGPVGTRNPREKHRDNLCIDPGPQSVSGDGNQQDMTGSITFTQGLPSPVTRPVTLGKLYAEPASGRLLVFAADGLSEGLDAAGQWSDMAPLPEYANNNNWYDKIADGRVTAEITFSGGSSIALTGPESAAWVIAAVPKFVPGFNSYTTLFDVAMDTFQTSNAPLPKPSFARDIYPILRGVSLLQWISTRAAAGHGRGRPGYFLANDRMNLLSDNDPSPDNNPYKARAGVFKRIRNPSDIQLDDLMGTEDMPRLPLQIVEAPVRAPRKAPWDITTVTKLQYAMLEMWRDGNFVADADDAGKYVPLESLSVSERPSALDRAALDSTAGTPFYPGIESWRIMRQRNLYDAAPLRISSKALPGDLTMGNALPWQADYLDCLDTFWPFHRPNEVTRDAQPLQAWVPTKWEDNDDKGGFNKMVQYWSELGFVITSDDGASYAESERGEVPQA